MEGISLLPIKLETSSLISPNIAASPSKSLSINQIAAQLASSKASQSGSTNLILAPKTNASLSTLNGTETKSSNPIVAKMTEALSLKQSPTLTKQLTKPSTSDGAMQVITQYMCRYCGQQFDSTEKMQRHIQEHVEGKTPHECSVCGKTYRTPSKLQRHVRVHSGERPYACSVCGRRFTRSDHVKQHMKVHFQANSKETNACHLCADMKFNRRQALHAHLQQQHGLSQVFTCHQCGEAFKSLEEMQTHKLSHDQILNSFKDGAGSLPPTGIAKFSMGVQKAEQPSMNLYDYIKIKPKPESSTSSEEKMSTAAVSTVPTLKIPTTYFIPAANLNNVSALSNKLLLEGMEKMAKETEMQKKYEDELRQLNADAQKYQDEIMNTNKDEPDEDESQKLKIAEVFTLKADNFSVNGMMRVEDDGEDNDSGVEHIDGKETTHMVNGDGMSMFILPTPGPDGGNDKRESDMETEESEQNSSKDSNCINREGDDDKSDGDSSSEKMDDSGVADVTNGDGNRSEDKISKQAEGYTKPCPRSKKPGFVPIAAKPTETKTVSSGDYNFTNTRSLLTTALNPKLNELIKNKVEGNLSSLSPKPSQGPPVLTPATANPTTTFIVTNPALNQQLPKLTLIPNLAPGKILQQPGLPTSFTSILPGSSSSSVTLAAIATSMAGVPAKAPAKPEMPKLIKCEHCCIYFEDTAMSMLHNTLHSADSADPYTCRKCYKKLGNRLEFMAHMVWHLEPNMDI